MMNRRLFVAFALVLAVASPARAQQLKLEIKDGRVTLEATSVPVRAILAEWAKVGGTKVVGAEKVTGAPLTLKLVGMPEPQALDIILRNVAGFMAAPRQASAAPGASAFDRILIMANSSAPPAQAAAGGPRPAGPSAAVPGSMAGTQRRVPPRPPNLPPSPAEDQDDSEDPDEETQAEAATAPVFTFPAPPGTPGNPVFVPTNQNSGAAFGRPGQPGMVTAPVITLQPNANGQPTIYNFVPNAEGQPPTTAPTGFSVIGSPTPGMIQQPVPPTPGQPTPTRPPGGR